MSTGSVNLDILLNKIEADRFKDTKESISEIMKRYPVLSYKQAEEIYQLIRAASTREKDKIATKNTVETMMRRAEKSVLITGYSLSEYFADLVDILIEKSKEGVYIKFFVNNIETQNNFNKLCRNKGKFLHIYNYHGSNDSMASLHAKVISVDGQQTLITSANLSYHGQEGNIEIGTLVKSKKFAKQIDDIFTHLIFTKIVNKIE